MTAPTDPADLLRSESLRVIRDTCARRIQPLHLRARHETRVGDNHRAVCRSCGAT